jgi:hypothetical protein
MGTFGGHSKAGQEAVELHRIGVAVALVEAQQLLTAGDPIGGEDSLSRGTNVRDDDHLGVLSNGHSVEVSLGIRRHSGTFEIVHIANRALETT